MLYQQYITVDLLKAMEEYQPILEDKHPQLHSILDIQKGNGSESGNCIKIMCIPLPNTIQEQ